MLSSRITPSTGRFDRDRDEDVGRGAAGVDGRRIAFFALLGFIFLMTRYFQVVRGYSPLSTGVRLLPVAVTVGVAAVAGTQEAQSRPAPGIGPEPVSGAPASR
jgi:hypothetical protein